MIWLEKLRDASSEPVSVSDVKRHLRIVSDDQNEIIALYIASARQQVESFLNKTLIDSQWRLHLDVFPENGNHVVLLMPPVSKIDSISYTNNTGARVAIVDPAAAGYIIGNSWHLFPPESGWPSDVAQHAANIQIDYTTGVDTPADVPESIKHAILMTVGDADLYREDSAAARIYTVPRSAERLLNPYKRHKF